MSTSAGRLQFLRSKRTGGLLLLAAEVLVLILLLVIAKRDVPREIDLSFENWKSPAAYADGGYQLTPDTPGGLISPEMTLPAGSYTFHIDYISTEDRGLVLTSEEPKQDRYLNSGPVILSRFSYSTTYDFDAKLPVKGFCASVSYDGEGDLSVFGVSLVTNRQRYYRMIVLWLFLCLLADLWIFFVRPRPMEERRTILILAGMTLLASLPLFTVGVHNGDDLPFHILRTDAMAQELRRGIFPVRMESMWFYGYGYPPAIMYGDFLLYPFAFLRMCGFSMTGVFKAFILWVNLLTAVIGYYSFRRIFGDRNRGLLLSLIYLTSSYRMVNVYSREAGGEFSAQIFLPLVAAGMWGIYTAAREEKRSRYDIFIDMLLLGGGMAGVVSCHNLSAEMTLITLVVAAVLLIRLTVRPRVLLQILGSVGICLVLSAFYTVPFLDYYIHADFGMKKDYWQEWLLGIQVNGTRIDELFSFFHTPVGYHINQASTRMMLTPGLILMGALVIGIAVWWRGKADGTVKFLCVLSILMLFLSSTLFPWDVIIERTAVGLILAHVQFAWRYIGCTLVPLTLLAGHLLELNEASEPAESVHFPDRRLFSAVRISMFLALTAVLMTCYFTGSFSEHKKTVSYRDTDEVDNIEPALDAEYLLDGTEYDDLQPNYRTDALEVFQPVKRDGYRYEIVAASEAGGYIDFPLFSYPYYSARDDAGNALTVTVGEENRMVRVLIPEGFDGTVHVDFAPPGYWMAAWWLSVIACAAVIVILYLHRHDLYAKIGKLSPAKGDGA
ncbi:MAG: hypothetical protein IKO80_10755 [Lachnospiraceae bacterium]|nr:hypothetical protein [Lachnospiraceae bacterium]